MKDFDGFSWFKGSIFPPELRQLLPGIGTLAELKILITILDAYFQAGLDAQPLTFDQLMERTGLVRQSVNDGLKKLLAQPCPLIKRLTCGDTYAYEPSLKNGLPCHDARQKIDCHDKRESHDSWQSTLCTALIQEFGVASRVAYDIVKNRDLVLVEKQINYARYEIKAGFQPRRIAGFIVARIRDDKPMPLGYEGDEPVPDYLTDVFNHKQSQQRAGVAAPSQDTETYFQYRDKWIDVYRENTKRYPNVQQRDLIIALAQEEGADLDFWGQVMALWMAHKWDPDNVPGMVDRYHRRDLGNGKDKSYGNTRTTHNQSSTLSDEQQALLDSLTTPAA